MRCREGESSIEIAQNHPRQVELVDGVAKDGFEVPVKEGVKEIKRLFWMTPSSRCNSCQPKTQVTPADLSALARVSHLRVWSFVLFLHDFLLAVGRHFIQAD